MGHATAVLSGSAQWRCHSFQPLAPPLLQKQHQALQLRKIWAQPPLIAMLLT